jgi:hypothetical protein
LVVANVKTSVFMGAGFLPSKSPGKNTKKTANYYKY